MQCRVCRAEMRHCFNAMIRQRYDVGYWSCGACGCLSTEEPYWLQEAYTETATPSIDTGLVARNIEISRKLAVLLFFMFGRKGRYVDLAGGTGLLVRLMRDIGFDFWWRDPYAKNIHAQGFEFKGNDGPCNAVTAFEVLEHLEDPVTFISDALRDCACDTFIVSTELFEGNPPQPGKWPYYSLESGQHITFYQRRTLATIGARLELRLWTTGWIHVLTKRNLPHALLRIATGRLNGLASPVISLMLESRTMRDSNTMRDVARAVDK